MEMVTKGCMTLCHFLFLLGNFEKVWTFDICNLCNLGLALVLWWHRQKMKYKMIRKTSKITFENYHSNGVAHLVM